VELGQTGVDVLASKGRPAGIVRYRQGPGVEYLRWVYGHPRLVVGLIGMLGGAKTVLSVRTTARSERTPAGIGPGSTEQQVRSAYRAVRCNVFRGVKTCALGEPGSRQTGFEIRRGRVAEVWIADVF
jgi:hypothetical protein